MIAQCNATVLIDSNGVEVVTYSYDSWGKLLGIGGSLASTVGAANPFRYRGYYYDTETGLYYLQSRYYNPELGRFISKDDPSNSQMTNCVEVNLYVYTNNNPAENVDLNGNAPTYSGLVGVGMQIVLSANILCYQGFIGAEAVWFPGIKSNFGNGAIPWCYYFTGGSMGLTLNFSKLLNPDILSNPRNILSGFGLNFSLTLSVTFFLVFANKMTSPADYTRSFYFTSVTIWGVTVSKASGGKISTYGIGATWSIGKQGLTLSVGQELFGVNQGYSYYKPLPINPNAAALYGITKEKSK